MLGPLRSSRASSLGQAGVFLFACTLASFVECNNRLFQQVPQQNSATTNKQNQNSTTSQTVAYGGSEGGSVQTDSENPVWLNVIVGFSAAILFILIVWLMVWASRQDEKERLERIRREQEAQLKLKQSFELTFADGPHETLPPAPSTVIFSQSEQVIAGINRHQLGCPIVRDQAAEADSSAPANAARYVNRPKRIPGWVVLKLGELGLLNSILPKTDAQTDATIQPEAPRKYCVPQQLLSQPIEISEPELPEIPEEGRQQTNIDPSLVVVAMQVDLPSA